MPQNAPKWISVFEKFPGGDTPGPPTGVGSRFNLKEPPSENPGYGPGLTLLYDFVTTACYRDFVNGHP